MREIMLSIVVAFSLTTHFAMAVPPNYGYGGVSGGTHLVGRDGLCLEMSLFSTRPFFTHFPTRLSQCNERKTQTQLWNVIGDGTIRPMDDRFCLVADDADGTIPKIAVVTMCSKESNPNQIWNLKKDGTVVHVASGRILTGKSNLYVTVDDNENTPSQSWAATKKLSPVVANIQWLDNLCLQSTEDSNHVELGGCNRDNKDQSWALYGDGTIREKVNRNYCLTSQRDADHFVVISKCEDLPQQRWGLSKDNTINHPANVDIVMDVFSVPFTFPLAIVMTHRDGSPTQRWIIY